MKTIDCKELLKWMNEKKEFLLVDVREDYEFEDGHIENCKHIPMDDILDRAGELVHSKTIAFYCKSGKRAKAVADTFEKKYNHKNVYSLLGGYERFVDCH